MSMRAIKDDFTVAMTLTPRALAATVTGAAVDLANVEQNVFVVEPGAWTDGTFAYKLTESADNTTYTDVTSTDQVGTFANTSGTATAIIQKVSYIGTKRYVKPVVTVSAVTTGMLVGIAAITRPRKFPAA